MLATAEQRMDQAMRDSGTEVRVIRQPRDQAPVFDPVTGNLTPPAPIVVYAGQDGGGGPALVNFVGIRERQTERGGEAESESRFQLSVPLTAGPFKLGDEVQFTRNDADPQLVGTSMWIAQMPSGSGAARRRMYCNTRFVEPR